MAFQQMLIFLASLTPAHHFVHGPFINSLQLHILMLILADTKAQMKIVSFFKKNWDGSHKIHSFKVYDSVILRKVEQMVSFLI